MTRKTLTSAAAVALTAGALVAASPAAAAPTCFGKRATIVGSNKDPINPVDLRGTSGNDVIVGSSGSDTIAGRGGDDLICAGGGDDFITAGAGNDKVKGGDSFDTVHGGSGHDRAWGGQGTDSLSGGPGHDRLFGGAGPEDSLIGGPGNDFMDGGPGYDLAEFWDSPRGIQADLRTDTATGYGHDAIASIEGLVGSNFDDVLFGDDLSNMFQSGDGDDAIHALGSDGDGGADLLRTSGGNNLVDGGEGPDIVSYNLVPWPVSADLTAGTTISDYGTDTLVGIEHLVGSKEDDVLVGNDDDNLIVGNWGSDNIDGRGGVDELAFFDSMGPVAVDLGGGTADTPRGSDTFVNFENLSGSAWRDVLVGDDGPNVIWGGSRADSLVGLGDDDVLLGGPGTDDADGGAGVDECEAEVHNCESEILSAAGALGPWASAGTEWRWEL